MPIQSHSPPPPPCDRGRCEFPPPCPPLHQCPPAWASALPPSRRVHRVPATRPHGQSEGQTRALSALRRPLPPPASAQDASFPRSGGERWRTVSVGGGWRRRRPTPGRRGAPLTQGIPARAEHAAAATDSALETRPPPQTPICTQTRRCTAAASRPSLPEVVDEKRCGTGPARTTSADAGLPAPRQSPCRRRDSWEPGNTKATLDSPAQRTHFFPWPPIIPVEVGSRAENKKKSKKKETGGPRPRLTVCSRTGGSIPRRPPPGGHVSPQRASVTPPPSPPRPFPDGWRGGGGAPPARPAPGGGSPPRRHRGGGRRTRPPQRATRPCRWRPPRRRREP